MRLTILIFILFIAIFICFISKIFELLPQRPKGLVRRRFFAALAPAGPSAQLSPHDEVRLPESILGLLGLCPPAPYPGGARPDRSLGRVTMF